MSYFEDMASIIYQEFIKEGVDELLGLEKEQKQARIRDRVRFIRLLKEGTARTQQQAGALVGLKLRQSQLLWKQYRSQGLSSLLENHYKGSWAKLDSNQQARLLQRLDQDDVTTQKQLIQWLEQEMGIHYSQSGLRCCSPASRSSSKRAAR
ncbi:helix-turn-helix domain-containing protein [Pontibacter qinzhouensis]|nr:helix-turn-helix domain-containing protein [Pontibacter qinzhouensis]